MDELSEAEKLRGAIYGRQIVEAERDRLRDLIKDVLPMLALFRPYETTEAQIENLRMILARGVADAEIRRQP